MSYTSVPNDFDP